MAQKVSTIKLDIEEDIGVSIGVGIYVDVVVGVDVGVGGELRSWGMRVEMVKTGPILVGLCVGYTQNIVEMDEIKDISCGIGGWR